MSDIKIRTFTGGGIKPYIPSIAKLRIEVFHEFPYLYEGNTDYEAVWLKKYTQCKDSVVVLVFDGSKIVGASTGLPLEDEMPEIQKPFVDAGLSLSSYFYFGESVLQKDYRGRGLGHHFFDHREAHVKHLRRFKHICFCSVVRPLDHPRKPHDHLSLENFWKKRGYTRHGELQCMISWQEIGEKEETPKPLVFWIKDL